MPTSATLSLPAHTIDSAKHHAARRVADVLRSRSANPRTILIDDDENIVQAVRSGVTLDALYLTPSAAPFIGGVPEIGSAEVPKHILADDVAQQLFGAQKRSRCFALARAPRPPKLHHLCDLRGDILVLDGVRLLGNIGAIVRTACAFGAAGVVMIDSGLSTPWDRRLIRASRGHVFSLPVITAAWEQFMSFIDQESIAIASLSADAPEPLRSIRSAPERLAIAVGSERTGVSQRLNTRKSYEYAIPLAGEVESLNVSVAAGIALYEHLVS